MKKLQTLHKIVARDMALGFSIENICEGRKLNLSDWKRTVNSTLFAAEVERVRNLFEEQLLESYHDDPAFQKIKESRMIATQTLIDEMTNFDKETGGSGTTRLKAAVEVLEIAGVKKAQQQNTNVTILQISDTKAAALAKRTQQMGRTLSSQPTSIFETSCEVLDGD